MSTFKVTATEKLQLACTDPLKGMYKLSPFVWEENGFYQLLIRAVNPSEDPAQKVARIYHGISKDGLNFTMGDGPVIAPSTRSVDKDGCEDPTLIRTDDQYLVYYSGWNQTKMEGQLLMARGEDMQSLSYSDVAVRSQKPYINPKEATVTRLQNGQWILLFEYADEGRSKLAMAASDDPQGPWNISGEYLEAGSKSWDTHHLSPGPVIVDATGQMIMFYNGSDADTHWRIGWIKIDHEGNVTDRSTKPLISPPDIKPGETDIAFAASAFIAGDEIWLYYTTADNTPYRAVILNDR